MTCIHRVELQNHYVCNKINATYVSHTQVNYDEIFPASRLPSCGKTFKAFPKAIKTFKHTSASVEKVVGNGEKKMITTLLSGQLNRPLQKQKVIKHDGTYKVKLFDKCIINFK